MPSRTPLDRAAQAKALFQRQFALNDQRVLRMIAQAPQPLNEFVLEMGGADQFNGILVGSRFATGSRWHADLFGLRAWTDAGTSVTFTLSIASAATPTVIAPLTVANITAAPYFEALDIPLVTETDTSGAVNGPDLLQMNLSPLVTLTEVMAGDMIFATVTATTSAAPIDPTTGLPQIDPTTGLPVAGSVPPSLFNVQLIAGP
jgi:hypothetical protein